MWGMLHFLEAASYIANDCNKTKTHLMGGGWQAKYWGFEWVTPYATLDAFRAHFLVTMALGMCMTAGLAHRPVALALLVSLAYTFLLDMNNYLNHIYLMLLVQAALCLAPANAKWALDNWLMAIVYFYAGVAKVNEDWLRGEPLRHWLAKRGHLPLLGPLLAWEPSALAFSYAGLAFDLLIPFVLLQRRDWRLRGAGIAASLGFHLLNKLIFGIGVFPWMVDISSAESTKKEAGAGEGRGGDSIALPLRHLLYPGDVTWTEYGHRFSWRMKLRNKACQMEMFIERHQPFNPSSILPREPLAVERYVTRRQARKMASRPDSLQQFALYVGQLLRDRGEHVAGIYATCNCTLNYRPGDRQPLVDPTHNLLLHDAWAWPYAFVTPAAA
ncbi:vitamin Kdependent gamma-carboxylase [Acanthamoeba castellanii str. Neff]|uniref:Vitamin Kdependent gamma-carboxylase n=1 Tax=Acanthamoeba castellanii (strain ATCC 30010 / Neff) TaxID=1257118 RepID=L8HFT8_ACACF|nr:vitamin Kdependent gamma-carboxylase [Acanthamoeba castellanii str. Neff]ELR24015.1 vitamin Kdependent gamma-carboxylase [Acanthamoeba castellanii str. Neff]